MLLAGCLACGAGEKASELLCEGVLAALVEDLRLPFFAWASLASALGGPGHERITICTVA